MSRNSWRAISRLKRQLRIKDERIAELEGDLRELRQHYDKLVSDLGWAETARTQERGTM